MIQIVEGHYYLSRGGEVMGPALPSGDLEHPWFLAPPDAPSAVIYHASNGLSNLCKETGSWLSLVKDLGTEPPTGTDSQYNFNDDKCCVCGSTDLEIVDWKQGHLCADCVEDNAPASEEVVERFKQAPKVEDLTKALRDNSHKLDPTFLHPALLLYLFRVADEGGRRYIRGGKGNYLKGGKPLSEYYACALRHIFKAMGGEWLDDVSKERHLAHAAWNCLMACWAKESGLVSEDDTLDTKDLDLFKSLFKMGE